MLTKVSSGNAKDVDRAVEAAQKAFKTSWGLKVPGNERGRLLNKLADILEKNADELAALEALDAGELCSALLYTKGLRVVLGKHFLHAKNFDVPDAVNNLRYYAGWADKHHGQTIEVRLVQLL